MKHQASIWGVEGPEGDFIGNCSQFFLNGKNPMNVAPLEN